MEKWKAVALTETRPAVRAKHHVVSSGHYLASAAGHRMFERGGNAIDAGVAAGLALNVLLPEWTSIGGVAPILVLDARSATVSSISGVGRWPAATDPGVFRKDHNGRIPSGVLRCVTPAALGAWLTALERFGRLRLEDVVEPALELAEMGTPVHEELHRHLTQNRSKLIRWTGTADVFYPGGEVPVVGSRLRQSDLGRTLRRLIDAAGAHDDRIQGIKAAHELFYRGAIAREIAAFFQEHDGWLAYEDLASFEMPVEDAVRTQYRGIDVFAGGAWCQGPVVLQTLNILGLDNVSELGHNSAEYVHLCVEALKLAFADRNAYYGDPDFIDIPLRRLLSQDYARKQRSRIDSLKAAENVPDPGDPRGIEPGVSTASESSVAFDRLTPGTACVCAVDSEGNALTAAPSDGIQGSPVIPGLGFPVSSRGVQAWVDDEHPSSVQPRKRPFLTPTPELAMRDGRIFLAYATPGMDTQPQALVQFIANVIDFQMDPQQAIEAPRFVTRSFPVANDPHSFEPNALYLEGRIEKDVLDHLRRFGHGVTQWPDFTSEVGTITAVMVDYATETLVGAADPRRLCYAIGW
jgi:gamma-glutamyltranspeptidase / glutathione hydrolase